MVQISRVGGEHSPLENAGLVLACALGIVLLVFSLGYLIVYPNHEPLPYSQLSWGNSIRGIPEGENTRLVFSVNLGSQEKEMQTYYLTVLINEKVVATQSLQLSPFESREINFSLPLEGHSTNENELRVRVSRPADGNATAPPALELIDWFRA